MPECEQLLNFSQMINAAGNAGAFLIFLVIFYVFDERKQKRRHEERLKLMERIPDSELWKIGGNSIN